MKYTYTMCIKIVANYVYIDFDVLSMLALSVIRIKVIDPYIAITNVVTLVRGE